MAQAVDDAAEAARPHLQAVAELAERVQRGGVVLSSGEYLRYLRHIESLRIVVNKATDHPEHPTWALTVLEAERLLFRTRVR